MTDVSNINPPPQPTGPVVPQPQQPAQPQQPDQPPAAPSPMLTVDQARELVDAAVASALAQVGQPAAPAPEPAKPVAETNRFSVGQMVGYTAFDPYDGVTRTRYGFVVETFANEGAGARSAIAWLGEPSGPIGDEQLEVA